MRSHIFAILIAFAQFATAGVAAQPMSPLPLAGRNVESHGYVNLDERPPNRIIVVVTCLLFAFVLALAQGKKILMCLIV
jgi:hypothetical protein